MHERTVPNHGVQFPVAVLGGTGAYRGAGGDGTLEYTTAEAVSEVVVLDADDLVGSAGPGSSWACGTIWPKSYWDGRAPDRRRPGSNPRGRDLPVAPWPGDRLAGSRWRLIATVRRYDLLHGPTGNRCSPGAYPTPRRPP
jgi:hypothetical protein